MEYLFALAYAFSAGMLTVTIVSTLITQDRSAPLVRIFVAFCATTAVWNLSYAVMAIVANPDLVAMVYRLSSIGWGLSPSLALYYGYRSYVTYLGKPRNRAIEMLIFLPTPYVWVGVFSGTMLAIGFERTPFGWMEIMDPSAPANYVFVALTVAALAAFLYFGVAIRRRCRTNRARLHAALLTYPLTGVVLLVVIFHLTLPIMGMATLPPSAQVFIAAWLVVVGSLLNRYPVFTVSPRIAADIIVNSISDVCLLLSTNGTIQAANPVTRTLLGYDPAQLVGRPVGSLFAGGTSLAAHIVSDLADRLRGDPSQAGLQNEPTEVLMQTACGGTIPCTVTAIVVHDSLRDPVGSVVIAREIRELKRLASLASTDNLTGAMNRRRMNELIERAFSDTGRKNSKPFSVMMMDLDHFKSVNDDLGHEAGDRVLIQFSEIVRSSVREEDWFARWGGEEFMVVAPETPGETLAAVAERIRHRVAGYDFGIGRSVTCSFGVAEAAEQESAQSAIKRADEAMYQAKQLGRNRVVTMED